MCAATSNESRASVQLYGFWTLENLALTDIDITEPIKRAGGIDVVVLGARAHTGHDAVVQLHALMY